MTLDDYQKANALHVSRASSAVRPARFTLSGRDGYLRAVFVVAGRRGVAQMERIHVNNVNDALHLCTLDAAHKTLQAIAAHFPLTDHGYHVVEIHD